MATPWGWRFFRIVRNGVSRLSPCRRSDRVAQALGVVQSDGGTSIRSGLQLAQASIAALDGDVRHVILLSDGEDPQSSRDIAQSFANQRVSLSTIALGADADTQALAQLAAIGQGVSYHVTNPQDLARVFLDETTLLPVVTLSKLTSCRNW
jgi:Mg-chelatase subunit ChlD